MNKNEDTMYFGDENPNEYENSQKVYSEEDMYEEDKPLVTINSVEYDEGDYACEYSGEEDQDMEAADHKRHNNIIWAYLLIIVIIVVIIVVALAKV